jgi:hypothetical protein
MSENNRSDFEALLNLDAYVREKIPGVFSLAHAIWHKENKLKPIWEIIVACTPMSFFDKVLLPHFKEVAREAEREIRIATIAGPKGTAVQARFFPSDVKKNELGDISFVGTMEWSYGFPDYVSFIDTGEIVQIVDTQLARLTGTIARHPLPPEREEVLFKSAEQKPNAAG